MPNKPKKKTRKFRFSAKCRDCNRVCSVPRHEFYKASRPRYIRCGGSLDFLGKPL